MRAIFGSLIILSMYVLSAMPTSLATHGDTAYLIGTDSPFFAEATFTFGPEGCTGYTTQCWNFQTISSNGPDACFARGGWDPDPRPGIHPPAGFIGTCDSGATLQTSGEDKYIPYPNPNALDYGNTLTVSYNGVTFHAALVVCDNNAGLEKRVSPTFCTDLLLFSTPG